MLGIHTTNLKTRRTLASLASDHVQYFRAEGADLGNLMLDITVLCEAGCS